MKKKFVTDWFYSPVAKHTEKQLTGFWFWKSVETVKTNIPQTGDYEHICQNLENIYNRFDEEGYDVVNIIPLNIGSSEPNHALLKNGAHNYLGDTGYSITRGAVVVGKLRESQS